MSAACAPCLRRTWLVASLADHITRARDRFGSLDSLLTLDDRQLLEALAGSARPALAARYQGFQAPQARAACGRAGLTVVCLHHPGEYPERLLDLPDPPATLHVAGRAPRARELWSSPAVAVVGARRATSYGLEVARGLGRGLATCGVTVVSGLALGVDAAAHEGALEGGGATIAVMAGGADVPYPASKRGLHAQVAAAGAVLAELPPGARPRRWGFPARNRIIAGLAELTVVVEAEERSGALITARLARELGREVGAVPGPVLSSRSRGTNALLFDGAHVVRDARDVLDIVFGAGGGPTPSPADPRAGLEPRLAAVLDEVAAGRDTVSALARTPPEAEAAMIALSELELLGLVRRGPAGRYVAAA